MSTDTQDESATPFAGYIGGDTNLTDLEQPATTEQRLEQIILEADQEAAYHATEAKRRRGVAKAARQALNILREGDDS